MKLTKKHDGTLPAFGIHPKRKCYRYYYEELPRLVVTICEHPDFNGKEDDFAKEKIDEIINERNDFDDYIDDLFDRFLDEIISIYAKKSETFFSSDYKKRDECGRLSRKYVGMKGYCQKLDRKEIMDDFERMLFGGEK